MTRPRNKNRYVAELIRKKRIAHKKSYTQGELGKILGYKNGQFISNLERGRSNIPNEVLPQLATLLNIDKREFIDALIKDYEEILDYYLTPRDNQTMALDERGITPEASFNTNHF